MAKKKQAVSAHDLDRIIVRLPDGMRDKIAALAETNGRSMTAEVVAALEQHLKGRTILDELENTASNTEFRLRRIESFIEKHQERIEDIGIVRSAVEHLESHVQTMGEAGFKGLLMASFARELREMQGDRPTFITSDQVKELRRLLKTSGADEKQFLRYMGAEKIENIRDFERSCAVIQFHWKNPPA